MSEQPLDPEAQKSQHARHFSSAASGWMKWWAINGSALQRIGDHMCELAHIRPGQRVLDIATGIGEPALTAAQWVGPSGHVLATDIAPEMLDFGKSRAADMGLGNLEFRQMDAEAMDLPDASFDAVLCRFGLMFLPNLDADLRTILRLLVPGGWFAAAVWSTADKVPSSSIAGGTIMRELQIPPTPPGKLDSFSLSDPVALKDRLAQVGFVDLHIETMYAHYEWPSPDTYVEFAQDMLAIVRTNLANLSPERKSQILDAIREAASRYQAPDGTVQVDSEAFLVAGRRM
jgi:ubiquinone/menaquinone biosynthesis C-methylase UbiE